MQNNTTYTVEQIRAYITWAKWKYQPDDKWPDSIHSIIIEDFWDHYQRIMYSALVVYVIYMGDDDDIEADYNDILQDVTIPITKLRHFLSFYHFPKPKEFKLYE